MRTGRIQWKSLLLCVTPLFAGPPAHFQEHTIATGLTGGYQVVIADMNGDGRPDLIALASGMPVLAWYENPSWKRHVIVANQAHMINCTVAATDRHGVSVIVLASEFSNNPKQSAGVVSLLRRNANPEDLWAVTEIDRIPSSHRLRTADIDGSGKPVAINSALAAADAEPPDYRGSAPLVFYRQNDWKRQSILPENVGLVHGIYVTDWDGDGHDEFLTAGFEGIHLFKLGSDGKWKRTEIAQGNPAPWPKSGSSDVAVGRLGKERFLAAIEPWHGNEVAIYRQAGNEWRRTAIDDSLVDGHTILTVDLNGDGQDEVVAGYRGLGRSVHIYSAGDTSGGSWSKQFLDRGGMGAASCAAADLNGDGKPDIVCIGSATANLKWYENLGAAR